MIIDHENRLAMEKVLDALHDGDIFVYPTDTLYGFGGDARSAENIRKIYEIKERPPHMPVSIIVKDPGMISEYACVSDLSASLIRHFLPGALTLVLPAGDRELPEQLFGENRYLGFRIPDHPFCKKIMEVFPHPLISTSVNISGKEAMKRIGDIKKYFGDRIPLLICDSELEKKCDPSGSTVIKVDRKDKLHLLREGKLSFSGIKDTIHHMS